MKAPAPRPIVRCLPNTGKHTTAAFIPNTFLQTMSITSLVRPFFLLRTRQIDKYATNAEEIQRNVLKYLLKAAANTEWGKQYDYANTTSYETFAARVPINN